MDRSSPQRVGPGGAGHALVRLSTHGSRDPFAEWRESVCRTYTALTATPDARESVTTFSGSIALRPISTGRAGAASASRITARPQLVERRRADIAERPCDGLFVNLQLSGTARVRQRGIEALVRPGQAFVLDPRVPFAMRFDDRFEQICLHLPATSLGHATDASGAAGVGNGVDLAAITARPLGPEAAAMGALWTASHAALASRHYNDATCDDATCDDAMCDALGALVARAFGGGRANRLADAHLSLVRAHVAERFDRPLTPASVAARFGISVRHLHGLYARAGTTFGRDLKRLRLEAARARLLLAPRVPVGEVARASGFTSPSHFARAFRLAYGVTASAMRGDG